MRLKGLLLAGTMLFVPAWAGAEPTSSLHPAEPSGAHAEPPYTGVFTDALPILDREAPVPSYGPAPLSDQDGTGLNEPPKGDMPVMDHGAMNHDPSPSSD